MSANKTFTRRLTAGLTWSNYNFGVWTYGAENRSCVFTDKVTYGANLPRWKSRIKAGQAVVTALSGTKGSASIPMGFCKSSQGGSFRSVDGFLLSQQNYDPETISDVGLNKAVVLSETKSRAAINFSKSYRKATRQWQSGVFALELFKTAAMISNPAKSLRSATDMLVTSAARTSRKALAGKQLAEIKRMPRGARKERILEAYRRAMSDTYLEWVYGVMPTFQDAIAGATAFRAMASGRTFDTVRCFGSAVGSSSAPDIRVTFAPCGGFGSHYGCQQTMSVKYDCGVKYYGAWKNQNPSQLMPLPKVFGVSALDILPTAWEVIPWSFLVDYFINVGEVLDAWQMRFVTFSWLVETNMEEKTQVTRPPPAVFSSGGASPRIITCTSKPLVLKYRTVNRLAGSPNFETNFQVKIPGMGTKWLNIAALGNSLVRHALFEPTFRR